MAAYRSKYRFFPQRIGVNVHIYIKSFKIHIGISIGSCPRKTTNSCKKRPRPLRATSRLSEAPKTKDSRTIHWGMANTENSPRHVLYLLLVREMLPHDLMEFSSFFPTKNKQDIGSLVIPCWSEGVLGNLSTVDAIAILGVICY